MRDRLGHRIACAGCAAAFLIAGGCAPGMNTGARSGAYKRAEEAFLAGRFEEAERGFGTLAAPGAGENGWALYGRGRARLALARWMAAAADFEALAGTPEPLATYARLGAGDARYAAGDAAAALARYEVALERHTRADALLYKKGLCLDALGRHDDAERRFRELLERFPQSELTEAVRARLSSAPDSDENEPEAKEPNFWVQLGIFSTPARAEALAAKARGAGLGSDVRVVVVGVERGRAYHVRMGAFEAAAPAEQARDRARNAGLDAIVKSKE